MVHGSRFASGKEWEEKTMKDDLARAVRKLHVHVHLLKLTTLLLFCVCRPCSIQIWD